MPLITPAQLQKICLSLKEPHLTNVADLINELCPKYGITETLPFQMFLANVSQESGEFAHKEENMNYKAQTLANTFPGRYSKTKTKPFIPNDKAFMLEHKPQALANDVYGGRMGNKDPNDGFQFKGAGFIGITGRDLYTKYAGFITKDVVETSNLMKSDDRYALDSACWYFAILKKLIPVANKGDFIAVVKGINGGTIGLDDRKRYYAAVKKMLPAK